ncbi:Flp family type IVb pilin [Sinomonas humi]|uniref:Pilus assembly protein n=1 Tax=Sinomonas humi TaxID=1338436 RepID=A0A0B2AT72_9MICC|nr:Flp family type IVb pilin [Sinomonas humi]KHL05039.1 pilus assembly protein [Sinomonas humi]
MNAFMVSLLAFWNDITRTDKEKGATAVEYGLLVALIAAVIVGIVSTLGGQINNAFQTVVNALP